jgi:diguanylate cyclase (GGDEF)-like protein/PAS domain S-box-containing protein
VSAPSGRLVVTAVFATAFGLAVVLGRATRVDGTQLALVWPAAGVAFVWLHRVWRDRPWPDVALLAVLTAAGNLLTGTPWWMAAVFGAVNALQALVVVALFERLGGTDGLTTARQLFALVAAAVLGSTVSMLVAVPVLLTQGAAEPAALAGTWVLRNAVSTLVFGAVGLRLVGRGRRRIEGAGDASAPEVAAMGATLLLVCTASFWWTAGLPTAFLVLPVVLWVAARASTTVTSVAVLTVGVLVVTATLQGRGPSATGDDWVDVGLAQLFVAVVAVVAMSLALDRDERRRLTEHLRAAQARTQQTADQLHAVLENSPDGVMLVAPSGEVLLANPAARAVFALAPRLSVRSWPGAARVTDDGGAAVDAERWPVTRALRGETVPALDLHVHRPGVPEVVLSIHATPLLGGGHVAGAVVGMRDVTAERTAAADVRLHRDRLASVLEAATEQSIVGTDPDGAITLFNRGAELMLGYDRSEVVGRTPTLLHDPDEVRAHAEELGVEPGFGALVHLALTEDRPQTRRWTYLTRAGARLQVMLSVTAVRDPDGRVEGFIGVATDITRQLQAERELAASEARYRLAFDNASAGMLMLARDPAGQVRVVRTNDALDALLHRSPDDLRNAPLLSMVGQPHDLELRSLVDDVIDGRRATARTEVPVLGADGAATWAAVSMSAVTQGPGGESVVVCIVQDVSVQREAQAELSFRALHDPLTGLPNRTHFLDTLEHALTEARAGGRSITVLFVDLDGFKQVNDTAGHAAGDAVLVQVAQRLTSSLRPGDTVARLGGDEFAVLCPHELGTPAAQGLPERIQDALTSRPVVVDGRAYVVGASIGAVVDTGDHGPHELLAMADAAMYAVKRAKTPAPQRVRDDATS